MNDDIGGSTGGGIVPMDIAGDVFGMFFPVAAKCEQAGRWIFNNIQRRDLIQRRELGLCCGIRDSP
ncbi:hypothetical protein [Acidithiobacillus ferriphilus]|uniref:hypothetical protein n=1 Tax=Acidithiobacillus ferriphilus TaxID=1689834 RepID=UPI002DBBA9E4|nr:hypothetical protein [Acidithiobacillus ferriphilus]MEB8536165.1 hypothetical protein [Acidithiobacillus ferriphilus]